MESNTDNSLNYFQNNLPVAHAAHLESMMEQYHITYPDILTWLSCSQSLMEKETKVFLLGLH